jgi:hypothetical protein
LPWHSPGYRIWEAFFPLPERVWRRRHVTFTRQSVFGFSFA